MVPGKDSQSSDALSRQQILIPSRKRRLRKYGQRQMTRKALASLQLQQILFKNSTEEVLRQQDSNRKGSVHVGSATSRVLWEWRNICVMGRREVKWQVFLQRPQFLQGLTRNKYLLYLPAMKKWSILFLECINVSCLKSTVHSLAGLGKIKLFRTGYERWKFRQWRKEEGLPQSLSPSVNKL